MTSPDAKSKNVATPTEEPVPKPQHPFVRYWDEFRGQVIVAPIPDGKKKVDAIADLDVDLKVESAAVARFVLAEVKDQAEKKRAAHRTIETKATSVIGFATAVIVFATGFNASVLLTWKWGMFPAVVPMLVFEFIAIIAGIMALQVQSYRLPDAALYNYPYALEEPLNEARIAMALSQTWRIYEADLDAGNRIRSRRLWVALLFFVLGVLYTVAITIGYLAISPEPLHFVLVKATGAGAPGIAPKAILDRV